MASVVVFNLKSEMLGDFHETLSFRFRYAYDNENQETDQQNDECEEDERSDAILERFKGHDDDKVPDEVHD